MQSTEGEGGDQTDAPTHQALVPKKEDFVLEKEIIDVSYFAMQSILRNSKSDHYQHPSQTAIYACSAARAEREVDCNVLLNSVHMIITDHACTVI